MELRPYQINAINNVRSAMSTLRRVILYAPCGAGKTVMAADIVASAVRKQKKVAFVVNRIGLVKQTSKVFYSALINHGIIQGANSRATYSNVLVCSIATLARRGFPDDLDIILIDESHGATAKSYVDLIQAYKHIPIIGLTGTPFTKGLGRKYEWGTLFEKVVVTATIKELTDQGYLVPFDMYAPTEPDLTGVKIVRGDYDERQLGIAVDKDHLVGDIVEHWKRIAPGLSTVVFATNIAHSTHICEQFVAAGVSCAHIDCYTPEDIREEVLKKHASGEITIVSNVGILTEGHDNPKIQCMILARPTRSLSRYIQMAGRSLRPYPGKERAIIIDHSGTVHRLGFPDDDLPLELDDGKKQEPSDSKPKEKTPHKCPKCFFMIPAGIAACPKCGTIPQKQDHTQHEKGELKKLDRKKQFSYEEKWDIWAQALGLMEMRKKSPGWASHLYKSIVGVWPKGLAPKSKPPSEMVIKMELHNRIAYAKSKRYQK